MRTAVYAMPQYNVGFAHAVGIKVSGCCILTVYWRPHDALCTDVRICTLCLLDHYGYTAYGRGRFECEERWRV
jgi:hypothetical protein